MDDVDAILHRALRMWPARPAKVLFRVQEAVLLRTVALTPPVLDLGCGNGEFAALLDAPATVGVDHAADACARARDSGRYAAVVAGDLARLPFAGATFASAYCNSTLEHVDRPEQVVREIARVLRTGGRLALTVPTPDKRHWLFFGGYAERALGDPALAERYRAAFDAYWSHRHYFRPAELAALLDAAGFTVERLVEYESRRQSQLLDILNQLRVDVAVEVDGALRDLVTQGIHERLHRFLAPMVREGPVPSGAGVLCVAVRR